MQQNVTPRTKTFEHDSIELSKDTLHKCVCVHLLFKKVKKKCPSVQIKEYKSE